MAKHFEVISHFRATVASDRLLKNLSSGREKWENMKLKQKLLTLQLALKVWPCSPVKTACFPGHVITVMVVRWSTCVCAIEQVKTCTALTLPAANRHFECSSLSALKP